MPVTFHIRSEIKKMSINQIEAVIEEVDGWLIKNIIKAYCVKVPLEIQNH